MNKQASTLIAAIISKVYKLQFAATLNTKIYYSNAYSDYYLN